MIKEAVIIDSGVANLGSLQYALERVGCAGTVSLDPGVIRSAERVVLPGVGSARPAMDRLRETGLTEVIPVLTQPLLGICLGMQLLGQTTAEGDVSCLGILDYEARRIFHERVPHMGWNRLEVTRESPLTEGLDDSWTYFVHGYSVSTGSFTTATTTHGETFSAAISDRNFHAVQFHPERSSTAGRRLLENFLNL